MISISRRTASELSEKETSEVKSIFNADQKHESEKAKLKFEDQWLGPYFFDFPKDSHIFLAKDETDKTIGYLIGICDSSMFLKSFSERVGVYSLYEDLFERYPAHLHINLSPECRGKGVGSDLIQAFVLFLRQENVKGVHLVTSKDARNVVFYRRNGFLFESERTPKNHTFLFLGQEI